MADPQPEDTPGGAAMSVPAFVFRLLSWFKDELRPCAVIGCCLLLEMGFNALVPLAFQHLIDHAIVPRDWTVLLHTLLLLGAGTLLVSATGLYGDYLYARISGKVLAGVRTRLFSHLQTLSHQFFQTNTTADINARYSTDLAGVEQALRTWIAWGIKPALDLTCYTVVLFTIDWRLALVAQLIWPLALVGPRFFAPRATVAGHQRKHEEARLLAAVEEAAAGRQVVRAFGLEKQLSDNFLARATSLATVGVRGAF